MCYADFETIVEKCEKLISDKTEIYQKHIPCGFCIIIVDDQGNVVFSKVYRGKKCIQKFCEVIVKSTENLFIMLEKFCPMKQMSEIQKKKFKDSNECHICGEKFKEMDIKV